MPTGVGAGRGLLLRLGRVQRKLGVALPPPSIDSVTPDEGELSGGTLIVIAGANFQNGCTVSIGGAPATGVTFNSETEIECNTPSAESAQVVDVVVTNPDEQLATLVGGFSYFFSETFSTNDFDTPIIGQPGTLIFTEDFDDNDFTTPLIGQPGTLIFLEDFDDNDFT